jgi:alpha-beta hydrolase superfamily lysophospholipase
LNSADEVVELGVSVASYAQTLSPHPVFLVGSSLGGAIALSVAHKLEKDQVAGVVLLAPMLKLSVSPTEQYLLSGLSYIVPTWAVIPSSASSSKDQCRDPVKCKECDDDPLSVKGSLRVASAATCVDLASQIQNLFGEVKCPLLIAVADQDVVVDKQGALDLYEKAASTDKTLQRYPALHALLCEPSPLVDEIQQNILEWVNARGKK